MKPGDMIKFVEEHYSHPGFAYVEDWVGIVLEYKIGAPNLEPQISHHRDKDEMWVMWTSDGTHHIGHYDEIWWNKLNYKPFEVIDDSHKN